MPEMLCLSLQKLVGLMPEKSDWDTLALSCVKAISKYSYH